MTTVVSLISLLLYKNIIHSGPQVTARDAPLAGSLIFMIGFTSHPKGDGEVLEHKLFDEETTCQKVSAAPHAR